MVANHWLRTPPSPWITSLRVAGGFDVAGTAIVERVHPGDLVVTQDIPLAARVLERGAIAVNPRGDLYAPDNMAERLSLRNFMDELRGSGVQTGGPAAFHARDKQAFANQLDRWLAQRTKQLTSISSSPRKRGSIWTFAQDQNGSPLDRLRR